MADFEYNAGLGRAHEFARRILDNDPATSAFVVVVIDTTETDPILKDIATLDLIIANVNTNERAANGWTRKVIDETGENLTVTIDTGGDKVDIDFDDLTWTNVLTGNDSTDLVVTYAPDTGGADSTFIPITQHDFAITTDGSNVTAQLAAAGFFSAS